MKALVAVVFVGFASSVAAADAVDALKVGVRAYATGKFRDAVRILVPVANSGANATVRVRAYKMIAASHLAVGNRAAAKEAIALLLGVDPTATFEAGRFPKRVLAMFDEVRKGLSGKVVVVCDRPDAKVEVAGRRKPSPCGDFDAVPIGQQVVKATAPDEPAMTRNVVVHIGKVARVEFKFGPGFGFLTLTTTPPDAVVTLDGQPAATTPLSKYRLSVGRHTIFVQRAGYRDKTQSVDISRGVESPLTIALERIPVAATTKPALVIEKKPEPRVVAAPPISKARRALAWSLVGTGIAALAVGVALHLNVNAEKSGQDRANSETTGAYSTANIETLKTREWIANGMLILSGAVSIAGTILLVVRGKSAPTVASPTGAKIQGLIRRDGALVQVGWVY